MPAGRLAGWLAGRLEERGRGGGTPDDCGRRCCCWYACWLLIPKPLRVVVCACESMVTAWFGVALVARPLDPDDDYDGADAGTDYSLSRFVIAGDRRALPRALCTPSRFPNEATSAGGVLSTNTLTGVQSRGCPTPGQQLRQPGNPAARPRDP